MHDSVCANVKITETQTVRMGTYRLLFIYIMFAWELNTRNTWSLPARPTFATLARNLSNGSISASKPYTHCCVQENNINSRFSTNAFRMCWCHYAHAHMHTTQPNEHHNSYESAPQILAHINPTCEYIRLSGRLMAMDSSQTMVILTVMRVRVLLRPNRMG